MMAHTNTLKWSSFRTAFSGSPLVNRVFERDSESMGSLSTTPSACNESLSNLSSADTTMHPNIAHVSSPQTCKQRTTLPVFRHADNWGSTPILSSAPPGWMPIQAMPIQVLPFADSAYMGPVGVQSSPIQPQPFGNGITMHQVNGPGKVRTPINVPLAHHICGPKNYTPHAGIQNLKSGIHSSLSVIPLDAYAMGLYSPLVPSGNISSPVLVYLSTSDPTIVVPATQMRNAMPPCAPCPSYNATPMTTSNSTPNHEIYTFPNHGTRNMTSTQLSRQKKGEIASAHASHSIDICGKQSEADTSLNQTPMNRFGEGNELWRSEADDIYGGKCTYEEFQLEGCSNLFATWHGSHMELLEKFNDLQLPVEIYRTLDPKVYNVVFKTQAKARRAFSIQKEIELRMVPPKQSNRLWLMNPSPNNIVKFETKARIIARRGKSTSQDIVGTFLMSKSSERKGCIIWADQLKGNRIRIVGCEGRFMFPDGTIKYLQKQASKGAKPIGWVSYRSRQSKEYFLLRRSGNTMSEFLYSK